MNTHWRWFLALTMTSLTACSSSDAPTDSGDQHLEQTPGATASPPRTADTTELSAAALIGDWGHSSMDESPDGPVSIAFRADGKYTAKMRDGGLDAVQDGTFTFFPNATEAAKTVSFVGDVNALPTGAYVLLAFDVDGSDLFRIALSPDAKKLTFEPAARQRGQGLHATGTLGAKDTLQKDFNSGPEDGVTAAALTGEWGHSSMDESPDGPVSIAFRADGTYTSKMRDGGVDGAQDGSFTFFANASDAAKTVSFVGDVTTLPEGAYVLLAFDVDGSDLFRISLSADQKRLTFEPAARQRGQGLHATGTLGAKDTLEKSHNR